MKERNKEIVREKTRNDRLLESERNNDENKFKYRLLKSDNERKKQINFFKIEYYMKKQGNKERKNIFFSL